MTLSFNSTLMNTPTASSFLETAHCGNLPAVYPAIMVSNETESFFILESIRLTLDVYKFENIVAHIYFQVKYLRATRNE